MGNVINLADYGLATGKTGAQNDAAIASAITAVNAVGGGILVLPVGIFLIASPVILPVNVSLVGHGAFWSLFKASDTPITGGMVQLIGSNGASRYGHRLENFGLWGNANADIGIKLFYAVYTNVLKNLYIKEFTTHGIYMPNDTTPGLLDQGEWGNTIENCFIYHSGRGIELGTSGNAVHIAKCSITENIGAGVHASTCSGLDISGSIFERNGSNPDEPYGIMLYGCPAASVSSCYFGGNGGGAATGAHIYTDEAYWNGVERSSVDGLTISGGYFFGRDDLTAHAMDIGQGEITVIGGFSNRHSGKTIITHTGGTVNHYGFVSADAAGMI